MLMGVTEKVANPAREHDGGGGGDPDTQQVADHSFESLLVHGNQLRASP
jgi:hypothetical protein